MKKNTYRDYEFAILLIFAVLCEVIFEVTRGEIWDIGVLYIVIMIYMRVFTMLRFSLFVSKLCILDDALELCRGSRVLCRLSRDNLSVYVRDRVGRDYYIFSGQPLRDVTKKDVFTLAKSRSVIVYLGNTDKMKANFPNLFESVTRIK